METSKGEHTNTEEARLKPSSDTERREETNTERERQRHKGGGIMLGF